MARPLRFGDAVRFGDFQFIVVAGRALRTGGVQVSFGRLPALELEDDVQGVDDAGDVTCGVSAVSFPMEQ